MSCNLYILLISLFVSSKALCFTPARTDFVSSPIENYTRVSFSRSRRGGYYHHHHQLHAHGTSQQQQQQHSSGRRWKSRRKRQKFLPSPARNVSLHEENALMEQLGYVPPNVCRVSASSGDDASTKRGGNVDDESTIDTSSKGIGRPIAIQSYPLLIQLANTNTNNANNDENTQRENSYSYDKCNITPFPTLCWLTCPHVSRAISELERQGYVRTFQLQLESNKELATEWWDCHEEYASERWSILSENDREWLLDKDVGDETEQRKRESMKEMIQYSGVAATDYKGVREKGLFGNNGDNFVPSVKCLHSHYAHYRSQLPRCNAGEDSLKVRINLVGKWTHELLLENFPDLIL